MVGFGYYNLCKTQPHLIMVASILIKYKINKIIKWWSELTLNFKLRMSVSMLQLNHNFNVLKYYDSKEPNKQFILLFNENLRSNDLIIFKDADDNDITDEIEPYLGPMQNFHGIPLTPGDFNHKKIKVFRDGDINLLKTFEENEPIKFS